MPGSASSVRLHGVVVERAEPVQVERAGLDRAGQRPSVARLLPAEPDRQQLGIGELEEARRRERIGRRPQAIERGSCRGERDLLLEDDVEERPEAGLSIPQRWWTVARHDRGQVRIATRELLDRGREAGRRQRRHGGRHRDAPTRRPCHVRRSRPPGADRTGGPPRRAARPGHSRRATAGGSRPPGG